MKAKHIADVAEAARVYLERTNASVETVNRAAEIRALAERQMGAFLKQMPNATGTRGTGDANVGRATGGTHSEPPVKDTTPTLASIGITKKQSATAQKLADIPEPEFKERIASAHKAHQYGLEPTEITRALRQAIEAKSLNDGHR